MKDDNRPVPGDVNVQFEAIDADVERVGER